MAVNTRNRLAFTLAFLLVIAGGYVFWKLANQPWHKGKTVRYWVECACAPGTNQNRFWEQVVEIGPPAVPYLIQELEVKDTRWRNTLKDAKQKLPRQFAQWLPDVRPVTEIHYNAACILSMMGSNAEPAVPSLIKVISDKENSTDTIAVGALGAIGPGAKAAIPLLRNIATNGASTSPHEQIAAARALWQINRETNVALLVFQWYQAGPESGMLMNSTLLVSELGPAAAPAIPDLIKIMADPGTGPNAPSQGYVRGNAAWALSKIGIRNDAVIEALLKASSDPNPYVKKNAWWALWALDKQYANQAVPALIPDALSVSQSRIPPTNFFIQRAVYLNCDLASACEPLEKVISSADQKTKAFAEQTLTLIKSRIAEQSKSK